MIQASLCTGMLNNVNTGQLRKQIRKAYPELDNAFASLTDALQQELDAIAALKASGAPVIPEVNFDDIATAGLSPELQQQVRLRGCLVVRNTFERSQAEQWNLEVHAYIQNNAYYEKRADEHQRAGKVSIKHPQILDIYWSKPQVLARQSERLVKLRSELNLLWNYHNGDNSAFDPHRDACYVDRLRIREPHDNSLGLPLHVDACSVESWFSRTDIERTYAALLNGQLEHYNPFDAIDRVNTTTVPEKCASSVFRTYQGWTALTEQGPNSGTLQLVPTPLSLAWVFMRLLQADCIADSTVYPVPGGSLNLDPHLHSVLFDSLCSIPVVQPGDSVWWHPDVVHAVEKQNSSDQYSTVMYIAAAPDCDRNKAYQAMQSASFKDGLSPPDYPAVHAEQYFTDRAQLSDLSNLGRMQMGLAS